MAAQEIAPVILRLIGVHDAALWRIGGWSETQISGPVKRDAGDRTAEGALVRNRVSDRVSAKFNIDAAVARTKLVRHPVGERAHPTESIILGQRRHVVWISRGCAGETVCIVERGFVVQISAVKMILRCLDIQPHRKVVGLRSCRQRPRYLGQLDASCNAIRTVVNRKVRNCASDWRRTSALDGVGSIRLECLQGRSVAIACKHRRNSIGRGCQPPNGAGDIVLP